MSVIDHSHSVPSVQEQSQASVADYWALLKPRVMSLVVFSAVVGLWIAPGALHPYESVLAIFAIALGAGASGAINMWYDRDIDAVMERTRNRPIPAGKIEPDDALFLGLFLSFFAVALLGLATNWLAAALLAFASFFYTVIYTFWLKRRTPQNIVIGGASGAFPPMIGWVCVTGTLTVEPVLLFMIIFMWTPPHFWALALFKCKDYARAGVPMLPVTHGAPSTRLQMMIYTILLLPLCLIPCFIGMMGYIYGVGSVLLNGLFIISNAKVLREKTDKAAKQMFGYSVFYLFALFALMVIDYVSR